MRSLLRNVLHLALAWSLCFLFIWSAIDLLMSASGRDPASFSSAAPYEYLEGRGIAPKRGQQAHSHYINSDGLRRDELPPMVVGEKRILMVGDSTCYSAHSIQGHDWPGVVERELRAAGVPATTMNGGYPGYPVRSMYLAFRWFNKRLPVHMLVMYGGWNDVFRWQRDFETTFDYDGTLKKFFPRWPESLEPDSRLIPYDQPSPAPENVFRVPPILGALAVTSPLANYLMTDTLPQLSALSAAKKDSRVSKAQMGPQSPSEWYLFYLGLMIREAQDAGIQVVLARPFSVFRIPGFHNSQVWEGPNMLQGFGWQDLPMLQLEIERMDRIQDAFAKHTRAVIVDPTPGMLQHLNSDNVFSEPYMGSPFHTKPKGDALLGHLIAKEMLAKGLFSPSLVKPWVHPHERHLTKDYTYHRTALRHLSPTRLWFSFLVALTFQVAGVLVLRGLLGMQVSEVITGWAFCLGLALTVLLTTFLYQFAGKLALVLVSSWLLLTLSGAAALVRSARFSNVKLKTLVSEIGVGAVLTTVVIFAATESFVAFVSKADKPTIREYLSWMDLQRDQPLLGKPRVHFYQIYQNTLVKQLNGNVSLTLFDELLSRPGLHLPASPILAGAVQEVTGGEFEEVFLALLGVPVAVLVLPLLCRGLRDSAPLRTCMICLSTAMLCLTFSRSIYFPLAQTVALALGGMTFAALAPLSSTPRVLILAGLAGLVLFLPTALALLLLVGCSMIWAVHKGRDVVRLRTVAGYGLGGLLLAVAGHVLLFRYLPLHAGLYDSLQKNQLLSAAPPAWLYWAWLAAGLGSLRVFGRPWGWKTYLAALPLLAAALVLPAATKVLAIYALYAVAAYLCSQGTIPAAQPARGPSGTAASLVTQLSGNEVP